jgi:arylsulfatase A-like enzyme
MLPEDHDPDELLGIVQSYAGQVTLLDTCLGALVEFLDTTPVGRETLLMTTSSRGFPLGEHGRVGACDEAIYSELVHVPLMLRPADGSALAARSHALVEPADLWATLLGHWGVRDAPPSPTAADLMPVVRGEVDSLRDRLGVRGSQAERAIRTPAWYLRNALRPELFAKPDDRWEVNDVANRCQEVVECLGDALVQYEQTVQAGRIADLPPLDEVLRTGLE